MRAGLLLSGWYWQSAQHLLAAAAADSAMAIASAGEADLTKALGLYRRGIILQPVGAYREAVKVLREAIALLDRRDEPDAFAFGGYPFVTIRRVPRLFDLHAVPIAMFCCFFQFQGSNS